jgi:hypothetical protein
MIPRLYWASEQGSLGVVHKDEWTISETPKRCYSMDLICEGLLVSAFVSTGIV